jgi:hypothetical protein
MGRKGLAGLPGRSGQSRSSNGQRAALRIHTSQASGSDDSIVGLVGGRRAFLYMRHEWGGGQPATSARRPSALRGHMHAANSDYPPVRSWMAGCTLQRCGWWGMGVVLTAIHTIGFAATSRCHTVKS